MDVANARKRATGIYGDLTMGHSGSEEELLLRLSLIDI